MFQLNHRKNMTNRNNPSSTEKNTPLELEISFLRKGEIQRSFGISNAAFYRLIMKGEMTKPLKILGARASVWPKHEVDAIKKAILAGISREMLREFVKKLESNRQKYLVQ